MAKVMFHDLSKSHGSQTALNGVSMTVPDGAFVVLLGPTGARKTTTPRLVSGLDTLTAYDVQINCQSTKGRPPPRSTMSPRCSSHARFTRT